MEKIEEIVTLTKKMISYQTTKDNPTEIRQCIDFISEYFSKEEFIVQKFESRGKLSLMISYKKNPRTDLILNGHIDVVKGELEQFFPREENNKLFGRGAVDMKAGVAAYMVLMKEFVSISPPMALMIVSDEEIGGKDGTKHLLDLGIRCDFAMASEPNHSESEDRLDITIKEKGVLWLKIFAEGKSAHGSRPWLGVNAVEKLIEAYSKIKLIFPQKDNEKHWENTLNIGMINGGDAPNKIPDKAEMVLDIRLVEGTNPLELAKNIKEITGLEVEIIENASILKNDSSQETIDLLRNCVKTVTGKESNLRGGDGASDLRFFSERNIPAICFGPKGGNHHGKEEFVYLESLKLFYEVMQKFITSWHSTRI